MAEKKVFNWAVEQSKETEKAYRMIWESVLGTEEGFDEFLEECRNNPDKVDGYTFQTKMSEILKSRPEYEAWKNKQAAAGVEIKFGDYLKTIAKAALDRFNAKARTEKAALGGKQDPTASVAETYLVQTACDGYFPYDTVTTAGFEVARGQNLQMGCGEGKTGVLVFAAAHQAKAENKQVFLTSSTPILAKETIEDTVAKYETMGITPKKIDMLQGGKHTDSEAYVHQLNQEEVVFISTTDIKIPQRNADGTIPKNNKGKAAGFISIPLSDPLTPENIAILKIAYSKKIVIADNATIMQHKMSGCIPELDSAKFPGGRSLLADEADFVLLDQFHSAQQLGREYSDKEAEHRTNYRIIAREVIKKVVSLHSDKNPLYRFDDSNQYVDFNKKGRAYVASVINKLAESKKIDKSLLSEMIYEALVVEVAYKENRDYQIITDKNGNKSIVSEDRASGAKKLDLPQGVAQALHIKHGIPVTREKEVLKSTNITQVYKELFGAEGQQFISGTLGLTSESEAQRQELQEVGLTSDTTYVCSPKEENKRKLNDKKMFATKAERRAEIAKTTFDVGSERPVLVGCVSDEEVMETMKVLEAQNATKKPEDRIRVIKYTAASEQEFEEDKTTLSEEQFVEKYGEPPTSEKCKSFSNYIKKCGGKEKTVIVGTSIIGRGTTIEVSDEMSAKGGIHVIINGLHETSSRNQVQYAARTARGSQEGSVDEFIAVEELPKDLQDAYNSGEMTVDQVYHEFYVRADERQSNVRGHVNKLMSLLAASYKDIENAFMGSDGKITQPELVEKAKALLTERAFSIQNRACGNSEKTIQNEYETEIMALSDMYIARFKAESEGSKAKFDEKAWLNEHGYSDIADNYFEFTESKEKEIIEKFTGKGLSKAQIEQMVEGSGITPEDIKRALDAVSLEQAQAKAAQNDQNNQRGDD